jgi:hypothetical protein
VSDQTKPVARVRRPNLSTPRPVEAPADPEADAERAAIKAEAEDAERAAKAAVEEQVAARAAPIPPTPVREEIRREGHAKPIEVAPDFEPRDGDVLVVSYPEVTLPLPKQFSMMKFGGLIYTRQLRVGDDVTATARTIGAWITKIAESDGAAKFRRLNAEFIRKIQTDLSGKSE